MTAAARTLATTVEDGSQAAGASDFGTLLRCHRVAAGLSQGALAERARMSANGIGALERGYRRTPHHETLLLLAGALALDERQREEFEATAVRSGLPRRVGGASVTVGPWADAAITNLPLALTSFIGRERELDEIAKLMHHHRMVTLTGAGGVGKTQTALHVANALSGADGGAVCFIGLAPIGNPSLVTSTIASTLGLQQVSDRPLLEALVAYLKNKVLLLILDNCEHVVMEAATAAQALLAGCPHVRILTTSREALRAAGEYIYSIPSLRVPSAEATRTLSAADAVEYAAILLFGNRAEAAESHFAITDENAPTVADLCRRLDGIPLAIELAAARVNVLPVKSIVEKLTDRFRILTGCERTALPRQHTMRATIDWSYDLLSAPERKLFELLSVFAGGFTLGAATNVCAGDDVAEGDVLDLLSSLVDKSLLVTDLFASEPRYYLLESFRQYALEKLATNGERNIVAHRHAIAYLEQARQLERAHFYEPDEIARAQADLELDNWRAALHWTLIDRGDVLLGQQLTGELSVLWSTFAPVEGRRWLAAAMALVDDRTPTNVLARLDYTEATIANAVGQSEVQLASIRSAVARYRVIGDSVGLAFALSNEIQTLFDLARVAEGKSMLPGALALAQSVGNRWLVGYILRLFVDASRADGDLDAARSYVAEALQYYDPIKANLDVAKIMMQLSEIERVMGNAELALRYATPALATIREFNQPRAIATTLLTMAACLVMVARFGEAAASAREALVLARDFQLSGIAAEALLSLGRIVAVRPQGLAEPKLVSCARAGRILGFAHARLFGLARHQRDEQPDFDCALTVLRDTLGVDALEKCMAVGAAMSEEEAVEVALAM